MKRKLLISISIIIVLIIAVFTNANAAISFLRTDGFWSRVDDGYDGVRYDMVGLVGNDPGTFWGTGSKTTSDDTLIRNPTVCTHNSYGDATLAEWTGISPAVYTNLGSHTYGPGACTYQGFLISEYVEGDGFGATDAIELYNNTGVDIDFTERPYFLQIFNNGSDVASITIPLTGSIAYGDTYVIASEDITLGDEGADVDEDLISGTLSFSGDDAVVLVRDWTDDTGDPGPDGQADGAEHVQWATGPSGLNPTGTDDLVVDTEPIVQLGDYTDWNQVRYGNDDFGEAAFLEQSGLAFHGTDNSGLPYPDQAPFLVGKFCHVNNPITADNQFISCPMTLDLYDIGCGDLSVAPFPPTRLTFVYPVFLDETSNSGDLEDCAYPSTAVCADAVTFGQSNAKFRCFYTGNVMNEYTVAILGFMPVTTDGDCSDVEYDVEESEGIFISQEGTANCGCLFAMITEGNVTAVELISFEAEQIASGVKLTWETATETDNLGFNLYRAVSLTGERTQLNETLIPTNVPPGSPFGALYEFVDETATGYQAYFYWLEDVDTEGQTALHGPATVIRD